MERFGQVLQNLKNLGPFIIMRSIYDHSVFMHVKFHGAVICFRVINL